MKSLILKSMMTPAIFLLLAAAVPGQYTPNYPTTGTCPNGQCPLPNAGALPASSWSAPSGVNSMYDNWQRPSLPYGTNDQGRFARPVDRPVDRRNDLNGWENAPAGRSNELWPASSGSPLDWRTDDFDSPAGRGYDDFNRAEPRWNEPLPGGDRLPDRSSANDLFRLPALISNGRESGYPRDDRYDSATQTRYRVPADRWNNDLRNPDLGRGGRYDQERMRPSDNRRYETLPSLPDNGSRNQDPYVPVPLPAGANDEQKQIFDSVTMRYQNPGLVRSLRSMSGSQARQMFSEVARKIDERALEPSSYDVRTRRALRNLSVAIDNPTFRSALGLGSDSFRLDGFRNSLSQIGDSARVSRFEDAEGVLTAVAREGQTVGLPEAVIAYEFANAQVDTLDRFSALEPLDPMVNRGAEKELPTRSAALEEEIFGIGVEVKEDERGLMVVKPLRNSPAAEAGLEPGDVIVAINGQALAGMPMSRSVDLLKTSNGSSLTLRVSRDSKGERSFTVAPRRIRIYSVNDTRMVSGTNVGYLSLSRFSQNSTTELDAALNELHQKGMKSLIIDLRGNPGGLLTTCVEISDRFLPCGTIVTTKGRLSVDNMSESATYNRTWSVPLVVLIDGDSASASEIFAAAVQENRRGVVVGMKSYGKGSVQTHFPLNAASANLRLTTALFYSPTGRKMAGEGVTPDVVVNDPDGVANGDKVMVEALRIAGSQSLVDLAKAAGTCRPVNTGARSSSLDNLRDSIDQTIVLR